MAGQKAPTELGITAVDKHTLKVELSHPLPYFKSLVVAPIFSPLNQKQSKNTEKTMEQLPIKLSITDHLSLKIGPDRTKNGT